MSSWCGQVARDFGHAPFPASLALSNVADDAKVGHRQNHDTNPQWNIYPTGRIENTDTLCNKCRVQARTPNPKAEGGGCVFIVLDPTPHSRRTVHVHRKRYDGEYKPDTPSAQVVGPLPSLASVLPQDIEPQLVRDAQHPDQHVPIEPRDLKTPPV